MSAVCILTPVVIAAWPAFSTAVVAAASSLGYSLAQEGAGAVKNEQTRERNITLQIPNSQVVTDQLGRDQRIAVTKDGVTITFSRDARGRASLCVTGEGHSEAVMTQMGEELSRRVVQKYVYQRLKDEMSARQFLVLEEEVDENQAIRLKVRHWEN